MLHRFDELRAAWWPTMHGLIEDVLTRESPTGPQLADMTRYHLETGGKRLRAMLPLLVAEVLGQPPERMLPFGAACEMLHNATLVHDDLQDGDAVRRGRPTVWNRYGMPQAVNVGDAMFYWTVLLAQRVDASAEVRAEMVRRVVVETLRVIDGQAQEFMLKERAEVSVADYLAMVEGKTSGLFALPMAGAAVACGATPGEVDGLSEAARHLGVLFQVQDDLLDLYGEKGRDQVGNDVREGKRSLLVIHALAAASEAERAWLLSVLDAPREATTDADVAAATALMERVGAVDACLAEVELRRRLARQSVRDPRLIGLVDGLAEVCLAPIAALRERFARRVTEEDRAFCVDHLPRVSRTFALSIELLPESLRESVRVAYLLCRVLDTVEDDADAPPPLREALFDLFDRIVRDDAVDPSLFAVAASSLGASDDERALMAGSAAVIRVWRGLPDDHRAAVAPWVLEMSAGMRETCRQRDRDGRLRLRDVAALERYCGYVAGTVGALLTGLFLAEVPSATVPPAARGDAGWSFGLGLQLVNVLKDVAEDAERGVCWLPTELAAEVGADPDRLLDPDQRAAGLALVAAVSARARAHLRTANAYTLAWPAREGAAVRLFCAVPLALAWLTLREVERGHDALVPGRTPKVDRATVGAVVEAAMAKAGDDAALAAWLEALAG
jgi:geranylgeranyl pyrophosphate synthase/phytoene/squalene synthetase